MFTSLSNEEMDRFLHQQVIGRIGCHNRGMTYVVPISYVFADNSIFGHTAEGQKTQMARENPAVCFEVDSLVNQGNWKSVICQGAYSELTDPNERAAAVRLLFNRKLPYLMSETTKLAVEWPFAPENLNEIGGIIFRIDLHSKTGKRESNSVESFVAWG